MKKLLLSSVLTLVLGTSVFAGGGGDILRATLMVDSLEYQNNDDKTMSWNTYGYVGYDTNKIYIYSEGEKVDGSSQSQSENQLMYSRAISPYWDVQVGLGYDKVESENKTWGILAVQGLAPYFFETKATLLFCDDGNIGFRADAEYEALFTQKLILTPSIAIAGYTKDDQNIQIGKGLANLTLGARVRYEFTREFAPYVGIEWSKNFGNTSDFSPLDETNAVAGVRVWF